MSYRSAKHSLMLSTALALGFAGPLFAQDTPATTGEEVGDYVVVTGIRKSLEEARSIKRNSSQFVDAIVADDIGKLPDTNVAESLARVSGVQVDRGIGEGSDISIRGLRQNVILFNGRQIVDATGRGGNGLDQLGTSTYGLLSLVPSEIIGRLEVTKLAAADDIAGALGGIVDIVTRKPFDNRGRNVALSAGYTYDGLPGESGVELFGMYSDTFGADDNFGFSISGSLANRNLAEEGLNTFSGYGVIADNSAPLSDSLGDPVSDDPNGDGNSGLFHLDPRLQQIAEDRDRYGLNGVFQWEASQALTLEADVFYSNLQSDRDRHWIGYFAGFGPHTNVAFSENEVLVSGTVTRPIQTNVEFADVESEVLSSALTAQWSLSDNVTIETQAAYTTAESEYNQLFFRLQSATAPDIAYDFTAGDFGSYSFGTDLTDADALNLAILFDQDFTSTTDDLALRSDLDWSFEGPVNLIEVGVRYQKLTTENRQASVDIRPNIPANTLGSVLTTLSNPDYLSGELEALPRTYLTADEAAFTGCETLNSVFTADQQASCADPLSNQNSLLNSFDIDEELIDAYFKANFETDLGGMTLGGNVGVRVVNRDLTSTGNQLFEGAVTPNIFERTDTEVLPSATFRLDLNDEMIVRLGAARVVAFPNTEDLNNGLQLFGDFRGRGGSPDLDPFLATQIDASFEYYFADDALFSVGAFYKDIETFIVSSTQQESVDGFAQPFSISRKVNGESATVQGIEVLYQQPFTFLPGALDGFGTILTYSYIDSETPLTDDLGNTLPLPGLSQNNVNAILYYEKDWFSGRLAYNWRDEYLQGVGPANTGVFFDSYQDLSATASIDIGDNYALNFEAVNLLDSPLSTFNAYPEAVRTNVMFGRVFKATLRANW